MTISELISVMLESETIIIVQTITGIDYFKGLVKNIPEDLKDKEVVYLSHTKYNMYTAVK